MQQVDYFTNINKRGSKWSTLQFSFLEHRGKDKNRVNGAPPLPEPKLFRPEHLLLLCYRGHVTAEPDREQPKHVGGDGDRAVLGRLHGITSLQHTLINMF